jgi:homoserine kinase type II
MAILTVPSPDELASFAASFGLGTLRSSQGIKGGTVNTSYRLEAEDGQIFFLRIYEEQGHEGAVREAALLDHLAKAGVPTPAPLRNEDGDAVRTIAKKPGALFPWIDGDILCQKRVTNQAATVVGASLARIHLAGPPPGGISEGRFRPIDIAARCDRVRTSSDEAARARAEPLQRAVEAFARRRREAPSGLIHGDLFRDNVLWRDDKISALLDFESAHFGPFAYDIAVTILSWCYGSSLDLDLARAIVRTER